MNLIQERDHVTFSAKDQPRFHLTNSQWTGLLVPCQLSRDPLGWATSPRQWTPDRQRLLFRPLI